jgi:hypothetical protein
MNAGGVDRCLTPPTLARRWGCSPERILSLIRAGALQAFNLSQGKQRPRYRITPEAVLAFEMRRAAQMTPPVSRRRAKPTEQIIEFF